MDDQTAIQRRVVKLIQTLEGRIQRDRWQQLHEMASVGEEGIALENLADNLLDYSTPISKAELTSLEALAAEMGLAPGRFQALAELLPP